MITVGELRKYIENIGDDVVILVYSGDHSYREASYWVADVETDGHYYREYYEDPEGYVDPEIEIIEALVIN